MSWTCFLFCETFADVKEQRWKILLFSNTSDSSLHYLSSVWKSNYSFFSVCLCLCLIIRRSEKLVSTLVICLEVSSASSVSLLRIFSVLMLLQVIVLQNFLPLHNACHLFSSLHWLASGGPLISASCLVPKPMIICFRFLFWQHPTS